MDTADLITITALVVIAIVTIGKVIKKPSINDKYQAAVQKQKEDIKKYNGGGIDKIIQDNDSKASGLGKALSDTTSATSYEKYFKAFQSNSQLFFTLLFTAGFNQIPTLNMFLLPAVILFHITLSGWLACVVMLKVKPLHRFIVKRAAMRHTEALVTMQEQIAALHEQNRKLRIEKREFRKNNKDIRGEA